MVHAPLERVWALVTDIDAARPLLERVPRRRVARRRPGGRRPLPGPQRARRRSATWETTCVVTRCEHRRVFEWAVGDADAPVGGVALRARRRTATPCGCGSGAASVRRRPGLTPAILAMPDKEERIVARRLEEFRANMQATVEGIKQLAEDGAVTLAIGDQRRRRSTPHGARLRPRRRAARRDVGVGAGVLGLRRAHAARLPRGDDRDDPARHRHRPARRAHAGDAGDVGDVVAGAVRRPLRPRHRHQRPAGDGGLARRPLRPAGHPHPRDDRDHPHDHRRRAAQPRRRGLHAAAARRRGTQPPLTGAAGARPRSTSPRSARPTCASPASSPTAGSATRSSPRPPTCSSTRSARAPPRPAAASTSSTSPSPSALEFTDDVEAAGRRHADGYAFTFGAMGSADAELLQRRLRPPGLRRRRRRGAAAVARRRPRGGGAARARSRSGSAPTSSAPTTDRPSALRRYRDAGVTTLRVGLAGADRHGQARRPRPPPRPRPRRRSGGRGLTSLHRGYRCHPCIPCSWCSAAGWWRNP